MFLNQRPCKKERIVIKTGNDQIFSLLCVIVFTIFFSLAIYLSIYLYIYLSIYPLEVIILYVLFIKYFLYMQQIMQIKYKFITNINYLDSF